MEKQIKKRIINISLAVISTISVVLNVFLINECNKLINQVKNNVSQTLDDNETSIEKKADNKQQEDKKIEKEDKKEEQKIEYVYKYIEGEEKEVLVEKEVEVPASSTDATVTYIDANGNTKNMFLPSGTTINFSAGEHGAYDAIPSPIVLSDNQQIDITDTSYNPSKVEVNYIFKGFTYSGDVMECKYSLADNIVNVECKQISDSVIKNNIIYIKHEYIENTGTQYIDTGLKFNRSQPKVEMKIKDLSVAGDLFGTYNGENQWAKGWGLFDDYNLSNKLYIHFNSNQPFSVSDYQNGIFTMDRNKVYYNGTLVHTQGTIDSFACNNSLFLLSGNFGSSHAVIPNTKLEYCKVWISDDLKLDLIPAERVNDNEIGLLNDIDGTFFQNKGTGKFKYPGSKIIPGTNAGKIMASGTYNSGSSITLTAIANNGYTFVGWSDNNTNAERTITIGDNTVYTALFEQD